MVHYVPNSRKPLENLQQEMDYSRGRPLNPNLDISLPTYVIENAIVRAIARDNFAYLTDYVRKCPTNITQYIYHEVYTSQKPMQKKITICSPLYHAIRENALGCVRVLMQNGAMAFQSSYVLHWGGFQDGEPTIEIIEKPNIAWLADLILGKEIEFSSRILKQMKMANVDFGIPVEVRAQRLQQPTPNSTKTIRYSDAWECIEKAIEKSCQREELANFKAILKKLHSAYNTDKLEPLYMKTKETRPKKISSEQPEAPPN
ncbi:unnamed protein product [Hydatigera taeniaeformis]|uniref:ANK_REP_REGION domain-containing protein n=1 Tax=Hydatigena taeniaeformis TaxID=6205 RepID=A0A0R3WHT0_HYDTA|nr:unnamed protein product [Hydatigera taeniaeformis]